MGQQQDTIVILSQKLVGYTTSKAGFHNVNGLPKYKLVASINGDTPKEFEVTFHAHHVLNKDAFKGPLFERFAKAIKFDWNDFNQNGVALPSFGASTSPLEERLLAREFGATHVGGHDSDAADSLKKLVQRHNELSELLTESPPDERLGLAAEYNKFLGNSESTANGLVTKVRAELQRPGNGVTLHLTDPDNPVGVDGERLSRPYKMLGDQIDAKTGRFLDGSEFADDPLVRQGGIHGSGAQQFQVTPWQNDPEIDIQTARFSGEREVPRLITGEALARQPKLISNLYDDPNYTKAEIDKLALTPDGTFSSSKIAVAALSLEGLKQVGFVGDALGLAASIAEAHRLVGNGQVAEAEQELARHFGEASGGAVGGIAGGVFVSAVIAGFFVATPPITAGAVVLFATVTGSFYGGHIGEVISQRLVAELQTRLNGGEPLVLDDLIHIVNEIAESASGSEIFQEFTGPNGVKGYEMPASVAEGLEALPGNGDHSVFELGGNTSLFVAGGLAPGQTISLLGPRGFDVVGALRNKPIAVGISDSGEKFTIIGQDFLTSYNPYVDNPKITKQAVFEAITGFKLFADDPTAGFSQILDQLERAATFDQETNPTILIDRTYAETLNYFGYDDEVFALSDGQIHRRPGGLKPGESVNLLEGERAGNPHTDPIVAYGLNKNGTQFEVTREGIRAIVEIVSEFGGELEDKVATDILSKQAADLENEIQVSLRELLEEGDGEPPFDGTAEKHTHGLKLPSPKIIDRFAVFSDSDGDGALDAVTRVTLFSNNTQIRQPFKIDPSGNLITEERVALYRLDQALDGEAIGSLFGSQLSNALVGDNLFAEIATGSVLSSILGNLGESIDIYFTDNGIDSLFSQKQRLGTGDELSLDEAVERSFENFGADVLTNLRSAGVSTLSGLLVGELGEALGIDGGFEGQLFQTITSKTVGTVANTVVDNAIQISNGSTIDIFQNLDPSTLLESGAGAVSSFVGGYLAREIVTADSQAGAIGGSIGGALGSTIGLGLAGVGFFGGLGSSGLGVALGGALSSTILGVSLGAIILPGVGAFLGTILGTVLGDVFDDVFGGRGYPKGTANISLDFDSGLYYESGSNGANGGGQQLALVTSLAERAEVLVNSYLDMLGGENANSHSPTISFYQVGPGSSSAGLHISVQGPGGEGGGRPLHHTRLYPSEITGAAIDQNVELAVLAAIRAVQIKGGDFYLKRAVLASEAKDLRAFAGDLQIAEDYKIYLQDRAIIDALIAADPDSAFAAGWLITLLRAEELGLTTWQESDFYGGLDGLLVSLDVERVHGIPHEDVAFSLITETLDDGSERKDLLLRAGQDPDAEIIARINGFEDAVNLNLLEPGTTHGAAGKDLWFAGSDGGTFTDRTNWRDQQSHDILIGNAGDDTIRGGLGWDFIQGHSGNDTLYGGRHEDTVFGGQGDDVIIGDDPVRVSGPQPDFGTDPNRLGGADANDGSLRDWFGFKPHAKGPLGHYNTVPERTPYGADELSGGSGHDTVIGAGGSDRIFGGAGQDHLYGGADGTWIVLDGARFDGDDYLEGGEGADVIDGGQGFDTASYALSATGVTVDLHLTDAQSSAGDADGDILISIEDLIGSAHDDRLTGNQGANIIEGGAGNDRIDGADGIDTVSYFSSGRAVEVDLSSNERETGIGIARILGVGDDNAIIVFEEDELRSIESVIGSAFDDILRGSGSAAGVLSGGDGNDMFQIAYDYVAVEGGAVATRVEGGEGFDTLSFAHFAPEGSTGVTANLAANAAGNQIYGVEYLIGSSGADRLTTGDTSDYLEGAAGEDWLAGGAGADTYIYSAGDGADTISDLARGGQDWLTGSADDTVSFGEGIEFRHVTGELVAARSPTLPSDAPANWFAKSDLHLGIRDIADPNQAYETSLSRFTDTLTIEFGGSFETWQNGPSRIDAGAGIVEHLQFSDSGHLELFRVQAFLTGSLDADVLSVASESAPSGTWVFSGAGADQLIGGDYGDILVAGVGADIAAGGAGDDQYAYWRGDGHDILSDSGGLDTLVFGGGIGLDDLKLRYGTLQNRQDPESFSEAQTPEDQIDLQIEIIDPTDGETVIGSVTILDFQDKDRMIERIRASARDEAIEVLKELDPVRFSSVDEAVQLRHASSIEVSINHLLNRSVGSANPDVLVAAEGQTGLKGYEGDDQLLGNDADNILEGGPGADVLDGGLGLDFASYRDASFGVDIDLSKTVQNSDGGSHSEEAGDVLRNIEGILGSAFDDRISGNIFENVLNGGAGNDLLHGDGPHLDADQNGGRDTFVFEGEHGNDIVFDFEVGRDTLEFRNIEETSLRLDVSGDHTVISHSQGSVQLQNVNWVSLPAEGASLQLNGNWVVGYGTLVTHQDSGPSTHELSPIAGAVSEPHTYALVRQAKHGEVTLNQEEGGSWSYTYVPTSPDYSGPDSFSLDVTGSDGEAQRALVTIDVQPESEAGQVVHIHGLLGNDHLVGGDAIDHIFADTLGDLSVLDLVGGHDSLYGRAGDDWLYGDGSRLRGDSIGGDDRLEAGPGADMLYGDGKYLHDQTQAGDDRLDGGEGDDRLYGDGYQLQQHSLAGRDVLNGGAGKDVLYGDGDFMYNRAVGNDDVLNGGDGHDSLFGDAYLMQFGTTAGDDVLIGGAGNDNLWGDAWVLNSGVVRGRDTFIFDGAHGDDTIFDFEVGRDVLELHNIDETSLRVSVQNDHTVISHSEGSIKLDKVRWVDLSADGASIQLNGVGFAGYGTMVLQQGSGPVSVALNPLPGAASEPYSYALAGPAMHGTVTLTSGEDDVLSYTYAPASTSFSGLDSFLIDITGADGAVEKALVNIEILPAFEAGSRQTLYGSLGNDHLEGGHNRDRLYGDTQNGRASFGLDGGDDSLAGGSGNDVLYGDGGGLYAGSVGGDDHLNGGAGADWLFGDARLMRDDAVAGNDLLIGNDGADTLFGDAWWLSGEVKAGDDRLDGGAGDDRLYGDGPGGGVNVQRGQDTFVFNGKHGDDFIGDFEVGRDMLEFQNINADTLSVSFEGANTLITHSMGSVKLFKVQWIDLDDVALII